MPRITTYIVNVLFDASHFQFCAYERYAYACACVRACLCLGEEQGCQTPNAKSSSLSILVLLHLLSKNSPAALPNLPSVYPWTPQEREKIIGGCNSTRQKLQNSIGRFRGSA